ncbi:hypothetical protein [Streptomyces rubradiris]|uniref:hypothetical protein n=1 Tax=Streptomyces rubradiris TaxID=285531 RepID=UPI001E42F0C2|nr:hypothetical protein [Streptomyces rubradiris]
MSHTPVNPPRRPTHSRSPSARRHTPERTPLDLPGAALLAVTPACLVYAVTARPVSGAGLAAAALTAVVLVRHERRAANPLLPPELIGARSAGAALGVLVAVSASMSGTLFVATYVLQRRLGMDAFHSTLSSLPPAVLMVLSAALCPASLRRWGARRMTAVAAAPSRWGCCCRGPPPRPGSVSPSRCSAPVSAR